MTDIAEIGFRVDTSDLEKGTTGLNKLAAAAVGVDTANMKMAKLAEAAGASVARAATVAADAEYKKAQAMRATMVAAGNASREEIKAARNAELAAAAKLKQAREIEANTRKLNAESEALRRNNALQVASNRPGNRVSAAVSQGRAAAQPLSRDMMPNRFNTANIAAQFQDIGVTASMGMNPMTIALQQGTQLSAIMNSMESPLKGIALALRSVFNVTSLLAIGFVGLIAVLIQMANWTKIGQTVLNGLADAAEAAIPVILSLGTILAILYAPAIFAGIASVTVAIYGMARAAVVAGGSMVAAWAAAAAPLTLILAAVAAVAVAFQLMGFDVIGIVKNIANGLIGFFVGAFKFVTSTWSALPRVMGEYVLNFVNFYLRAIDKLINESIRGVNYLASKVPGMDGNLIKLKSSVEIENPWKGAGKQAAEEIGAEITKAIDKDYVGEAGKWVSKKLRSAASGIGAVASGKGDRAGKDSEKEDPWEKLVGDAERKIAVLKAEQAAIGMTEKAAARLRYETELLNEAQQKGIILDEQKRTKIAQLAEGMAETEAETKRLKDAYEFLSQQSENFVSDLRSNLEQGKSVWQSFGAAVKGVVDDILNKIISSQIKSMMSDLIPSGGAGGLLGSIAGFLGGAIGGGVTTNAPLSYGPFLPSANGNAFHNGLIPFAKGGAFTNGIVSRATPFAFADGGAFGVMGEAGPEAVMPLHRGPDGSLGVRTSGGVSNDNAAPQQNVTYVINAPGASKADLESVRQTLMALAGPGIVEQRTIAARIRGVAA